MKNILYLLLIIFLSISQNLFSISKEINKIGLKEGLPDNYILTTEQDGDGFVWIGTENGLCRFDGYKFINFTTESKNAKEHLLDNAINKILYDSIYNTIWIATKKGGLTKYDCNAGEFSNITIPVSENSNEKAKGITDIRLSKDGSLWIATYNKGLKFFDCKNHKIEHIDLSAAPLTDNYRIRSIEQDVNGNLYIGHWGSGLTIINNDKKVIAHYNYNSDKNNHLPGNEILDICIDSYNNFTDLYNLISYLFL